jgi:hypothetical protein
MKYSSLTAVFLLTSTTTFAATLPRRDLAPATDLPGSWTYSGCYVDSVAARSLSSAFKGDGTGMSADSCTAFCTAEGYWVAGVEYSAECVSVLSVNLTDPILTGDTVLWQSSPYAYCV